MWGCKKTPFFYSPLFCCLGIGKNVWNVQTDPEAVLAYCERGGLNVAKKRFLEKLNFFEFFFPTK